MTFASGGTEGHAMAIRSKRVPIGALLSFSLLFAAVGVYYIHTRRSEGRAATWQELRGQDMLPALREGLPQGAKNIWFACHFYHGYGEAVFSMSDQEFLQWADRRHLQVKAIHQPDSHLFFLQLKDPEVTVRVRKGYAAERQRKQALSEYAMYDEESATAYYKIMLP
jgi:hypothetical protein